MNQGLIGSRDNNINQCRFVFCRGTRLGQEKIMRSI